MRTGAWLIALALIAPPCARSADEPPMGRLFFTPEQRAALEEARRKNIRAEELAAHAATKPKTPRPRDVVVNGVVMRNDGMSVIWVNGKAVENETEDGMRVSPTASRESVVLRDPAKGRALRLKVGQRADLLSGRVEENYEARRAAAHAEEAQRERDTAATTPPARSERPRRGRGSIQDEKLDAPTAAAGEPAGTAASPSAPDGPTERTSASDTQTERSAAASAGDPGGQAR